MTAIVTIPPPSYRPLLRAEVLALLSPRPLTTEEFTNHNFSQWIDAFRDQLDNTAEVRALANHLKGDSEIQTVSNVFHFVKDFITYRRDKQGNKIIERIRSPRATLIHGIGDCEDYTILILALLKESGYGKKASAALVAYDGNDWSHIFPVYNNTRPSGNHAPTGLSLDILRPIGQMLYPHTITKTMKLEIIQGQPISGHNPFDAWVNLANDREKTAIRELSELVNTILPDGTIVWKEGVDLVELDAALQAAELNGFFLDVDANIGAVEGLGNFFKKVKDKVKNTFKKKEDKPGSGFGAGLARISPVLIAGRGAYLALVRLNAFKLAFKFQYILGDRKEAKEKGLNPDLYAEAQGKRAKVEARWRKLGGKVEALKSTAFKKKKGNSVNGEPITMTTLAATAAPILAALAAAMSGINWNKDSNVEARKGESEPNLTEALQNLAAKTQRGAGTVRDVLAAVNLNKGNTNPSIFNQVREFVDPNAGNTDNSGGRNNNNNDDDKTNYTPYYILGGALLLGSAAYVATRN